jgi:hypothetical protein
MAWLKARRFKTTVGHKICAADYAVLAEPSLKASVLYHFDSTFPTLHASSKRMVRMTDASGLLNKSVQKE